MVGFSPLLMRLLLCSHSLDLFMFLRLDPSGRCLHLRLSPGFVLPSSTRAFPCFPRAGLRLGHRYLGARPLSSDARPGALVEAPEGVLGPGQLVELEAWVG